jgi:hypothetical protein
MPGPLRRRRAVCGGAARPGLRVPRPVPALDPLSASAGYCDHRGGAEIRRSAQPGGCRSGGGAASDRVDIPLAVLDGAKPAPWGTEAGPLTMHQFDRAHRGSGRTVEEPRF